MQGRTMSLEAHHDQALIETARSELDRAHRAVIAMQAGEVRRGLQLALTALQSVAAEEGGERYAALASQVQDALRALDTGALADMDTIIEAARKAMVD